MDKITGNNISASLGLAQLKYLKEWVEKKRKIYNSYHGFFSKNRMFGSVELPFGIYANRWLSAFLVRSPRKRDEILERLASKRIETRRFWKPLHLLNIFKGQKSYVSGVASDLFEKGICLPSGVGLKKEEQEEIIQAIINID